MSNVAFEVPSWTERDALMHQDDLVDMARKFVDITNYPDGTVGAKVDPWALRASLDDHGYDLDHLEVLDLQERIISEAQAANNADIQEAEEHACQLFEEEVEKSIDWENMNLEAFPGDVSIEQLDAIVAYVSDYWYDAHHLVPYFSYRDIRAAIQRLQDAQKHREENGESDTALLKPDKRLAQYALQRLEIREEERI